MTAQPPPAPPPVLTPLLTLDADTLREHLYTRRDELPEGASPVPLKLVHINKCPILAPENTLRPQDAQRIGLDKDLCARNAELLHQHPEIREKVAKAATGAAAKLIAENHGAEADQALVDRTVAELGTRLN